MSKLLPIFLLAALTASGCVSVTPYTRAAGEEEPGYSETKIQEDTFSIQYLGGSSNSFQRVADYALLRSAEVVLENGFRFFSILGGEYDAKTVQETYTSAYPGFYYPGYGWMGSYSGGGTFTSRYPVTYFLIRGYKDKPSESAGMPPLFTAAEVRDNIRAKYGLTAPDTLTASPKPSLG